MNKSLKIKSIEGYRRMTRHREFDLPAEDAIKEVMPLPDEFKEQLYRRVKQERKYVVIWGVRVSKVAVVILILLLTGMTVYAIAKSKFVYKIFQRNTKLSTIEEEMLSGEEYLNHIYYPKYVIDFEMDSTVQMDASVLTLYRNRDGETIVFLQQVIQAQYNYDNETDEERIAVNGTEAIRFSKHGETILIWAEYGYLYELQAPEKYKHELIAIAESLQVQKSSQTKEGEDNVEEK